MLCMPSTLLLLLPTLALASKSSGSKSAPAAGCTGTISSFDDVSAALNCQTININSFKVPPGRSLNINTRYKNVVINLLGDLEFGVKYQKGYLMLGELWLCVNRRVKHPPPVYSAEAEIVTRLGHEIDESDMQNCTVTGDNFSFNGGNHTINANGQAYWDNGGSSKGKLKPSPTVHLLGSGVFQNVIIKNAPTHAVSIQNSAALLVKNVLIDNRDGATKGAVNTDGFDISGSTDLTIEDCTVYNQDDCVAINSATNLLIDNMKCFDGHGISIGSIDSGQQVTNVRIERSAVVNSEQCFRIKAFAGAKNAKVENITYSDNTCTGARKFGVLFTQNYQEHATVNTKITLGQKYSTDMYINDINFVGGANNIDVGPNAPRLGLSCAPGKCNNWNFDSLKISGGLAPMVYNPPSELSSSSFASEESKPTASPTGATSQAPVLATPTLEHHKSSQSHRPKSKHHGHHEGRGSHTHSHRLLRLAKRRSEDIAY